MNLRRSSLRWSAHFLALGGTLGGCGGGPRVEPQKPAASAPPALIAGSHEPDLSPAPEPTHLVALARWRSPSASLEQIGNYTGFRLPTAMLLRQLDSEAAKSIDVEAPVDGVVALDPKSTDDFEPVAAFSFGVHSLDEGKHLAESYGPLTEI